MAKKKEDKVTIKQLIEAGAHFGHQKQRWNPKMRRFIFEERNGIYIIDLAKTMQQIRSAIEVILDVVTKRKPILFVGTKKQARGVVKEVAEKCNEFYISERWLGGMLTNLATIRQSIKTLERIEKQIASGREGLTKKELSQLTKKQQKLERNLAGIRGMRKIPGLLIAIDVDHEDIAIAEANKLKIPVLGLVDTDSDPDLIDYVIACNDDSLKSIKLVLDSFCEAIVDKKKEMFIPLVKGEEGKAKTALQEQTKAESEEVLEVGLEEKRIREEEQ